ncbi:MAG: TIGR02996 domain-containing protein [Myxococcales bacterium]|nr:TIGR02996 domain-containing protein [Myxococcales bacterium]
MSREAQLLDAVLAAPDDDTPRLAYADWLSTRGDARGELIAVQCQLARAGDDDARAPALAQRERELLAEHHALWKRPMRGVIVARFERGFAAHVWLDSFIEDYGVVARYLARLPRPAVEPSAWCGGDEKGGAALRAIPRLHLGLRGADAERLGERDFTRWGLHSIEALELVGAFSPAQLEALASLAGDDSALRSLALRTQDRAFYRALRGHPLRGQLTALSLEVAEPAAIDELAALEAPRLRRLEVRAGMSEGPLVQTLDRLLAAPWARQVDTLVLASHRGIDDGSDAVLSALLRWSGLDSLRTLSLVDLGARASDDVVRALHGRGPLVLRRLHAPGNALGAGIEALLVAAPELHAVDFARDDLGAAAVEALTACAAGGALRELSLAGCALDNAAQRALARGAKAAPLIRTLDLTGVSITSLEALRALRSAASAAVRGCGMSKLVVGGMTSACTVGAERTKAVARCVDGCADGLTALEALRGAGLLPPAEALSFALCFRPTAREPCPSCDGGLYAMIGAGDFDPSPPCALCGDSGEVAAAPLEAEATPREAKQAARWARRATAETLQTLCRARQALLEAFADELPDELAVILDFDVRYPRWPVRSTLHERALQGLLGDDEPLFAGCDTPVSGWAALASELWQQQIGASEPDPFAPLVALCRCGLSLYALDAGGLVLYVGH